MVYKPRMLVPGKAGATLPFTPAPSAPDDDASFLRGVLEAIPCVRAANYPEPRLICVDGQVRWFSAPNLSKWGTNPTLPGPSSYLGLWDSHALAGAEFDRVEWMSRF